MRWRAWASSSDGRDDDGAIFPIGAIDERLPTQEKVLGVFADDRTVIAFPVSMARTEVGAGRPVAALGIVIVPEASGVRANRDGGTDAVGHEAFLVLVEPALSGHRGLGAP